jgi:hypothetical protein
LEEFAVHAGDKVLMEVDDDIWMIVDDPQGILDQHLWHHLIPLLNIIIIELIYYIKLYIIRLLNCNKKLRPSCPKVEM